MSSSFSEKNFFVFSMFFPKSGKGHLITTKSTAGTPYSDPGLDSTREQILTHHVQEVSERRKQGIPKWFRK